MDLSFLGQWTPTATPCIHHDSYSCQDHVLLSLKMAFFVVILDSKFSKMTPKFVKRKSQWLHSSIKFAIPDQRQLTIANNDSQRLQKIVPLLCVISTKRIKNNIYSFWANSDKTKQKTYELCKLPMAHSHFCVKTKTGINLTFCWKKISSLANTNVSLINSLREE